MSPSSSATLETYGESADFVRFEIQALGTENVLLLEGPDSPEVRSAAQDAFETLERIEQSLSKFLPQSDVSLLNALGASRQVRVGQEVVRLLKLSREAWEATGGAFDVTVGELMHAWGLVDMEGRVPSEREIVQLRSRCGMHHVGFDEGEGTAWLARPGLSVDLGAIGKGHAVDVLTSRLQERRRGSGLFISGRSSIACWGAPPGETGWRFEVVHPEGEDEPLGVIMAEPGSISTSGSYARRFVRGWREYGHVIDPRTGKPAGGMKSVTVWTPSAVLGDVLSTALLVLGSGALEPHGPVEKLTRAWARACEEARASILYAEVDPSRWGGLRIGTFHLGRPGFKLLSSIS